MNDWYDFDLSTSGHIISCKEDTGCSCTANDRCSFYQGYQEGSAYRGFMVSDQVYFGDSHHTKEDAFRFSFGCVSTETNMFYDQIADGILGMGMNRHLGGVSSQGPIYESMKKEGVIDKLMFNICLGKNGGWMQMGGYDQARLLEKPKWFKLTNPKAPNYRFTLNGVSMHDHFMDGSKSWNVAFVDSGTTYTYVPAQMWEALMANFDYFCDQTKNIHDAKGRKKYCTGQRYTTEM